MNIQEKKKKLDIIMMQYSQLRDDSKNRAKCKALKNQAASIMYSPDFFRMLTTTVKNRIKMIGIPTRYQPDEFISETFMRYAETYDHTKNDNFCAFFQCYLKNYTITNMLRKEHPEREINITIEDEEGNDIPYAYTVSDNNASPEILGIMQLFNNTSKTRTDNTSENSIDAMQVLFDVEESISEDEAEIKVRFIEYISKIIPCINQANEHRGKRNVYYRAFATDFYIAASKWSLHSRYDMNENEAFNNMDLDFADFTLIDVCRSFSDFESTSCKTYAEIGVTERDYAIGKIETPFRNGVYEVYFKVTEGAVSQQRKSFHKDIGILVNEER